MSTGRNLRHRSLYTSGETVPPLGGKIYALWACVSLELNLCRFVLFCVTDAQAQISIWRRREDPRATFSYYSCNALVLREQILSQEPARRISGVHFFFLRLCYAFTTRAKFKPGASRENPRGTFLYCAYITLVLREQNSSQDPARRIPEVLFVIRLYCACSTRANCKPGASRGIPEVLFVRRMYHASSTRASF